MSSENEDIKMKNRKVFFFASVLIAVLGVAACQKQDPASVVQRRALERWNLLTTHQPVKAYDYLSPGYRATHTLDQYVAFVATARLRWKEAKVDGQKCDAEACTVSLTIKSEIPGQLINTPRDLETDTPVVEHWIASDGQWYFLPDSRIQPADVSATAQPTAPVVANPAANPTTVQPTPAPSNSH